MKAFQFTSDPETEVSIQSIILWIHTVRTVAYLLFFPFLGQCSLQIICHIRGPGSCTQILHLQREQVSLDTMNSHFHSRTIGDFFFYLCCFQVDWAYLCICHDRWKTLAGDDSICECCDSQCVTSKPRRAMMEGTPIVVVFLFPSLDQISRTHTFPLWLVGHVVAALTCTTPLADNYQKLSRMNESDHKCSFIY